MKVSLTFHELELGAAVDIFNIATPGSKATIGAPISDPVEPKKRKRRTKAEMEADRAAHAADQESEPQPRRRRKRESEGAVEEAAEGNLKRGRRRREGATDPTEASAPTSTTKSPSDDDISDADVAKKASEAAQELTPAPVMAKLEEFGVALVNDLDQEQRREFFDWVDAELAELPKQAEKTVEKLKRRRRKK